jgi:hypothetical protein
LILHGPLIGCPTLDIPITVESCTMTLWVFATIEWFAKILHFPRVPAAYAIAALVATAFCAAKFIWARSRCGT